MFFALFKKKYQVCDHPSTKKSCVSFLEAYDQEAKKYIWCSIAWPYQEYKDKGNLMRIDEQQTKGCITVGNLNQAIELTVLPTFLVLRTDIYTIPKTGQLVRPYFTIFLLEPHIAGKVALPSDIKGIILPICKIKGKS